MKVKFRTKRFIVSDHEAPDHFDGEDLAQWLAMRLVGWQTEVVAEDWGWCLLARKGDQRCEMGVYDYHTSDVTDLGALWTLRITNRRLGLGGRGRSAGQLVGVDVVEGVVDDRQLQQLDGGQGHSPAGRFGHRRGV